MEDIRSLGLNVTNIGCVLTSLGSGEECYICFGDHLSGVVLFNQIRLE